MFASIAMSHCNESFTRKNALKRHERRHQQVATQSCGNSLNKLYRRDKFIEHQIFCERNTRKRNPEVAEDIMKTAKIRRVIGQTGARERPTAI